MSLLRTSALRAMRRAAPALQPRLASAAAAAPRLALASARTPSQLCASLHTSVARFGNGSTDGELSARLTQEITYEKESDAPEGAAAADSAEPEFLRDFREQGIWEIHDTPGSDEITLTRQFGSEKIRVMFSIGDIDTSETSGMAEDDEEGEVASEMEEEENSFPVRVAISIVKPDHGALSIDGQAHDGEFTIENISFYKDAKLGTELTADADWARRGLYIGPQFDTLDEAVQTQFEAFLNERGINSDLALFVPDFAELKEQREYCGWLENVRDFVDA